MHEDFFGAEEESGLLLLVVVSVDGEFLDQSVELGGNSHAARVAAAHARERALAMSDSCDLQSARHRLAELDRERATLAREIADAQVAGGMPNIGTAEGRVELFASLFRARTDMFAKPWQSRTDPDRSGWAPRCVSEWRPGVLQAQGEVWRL